MTGVSGGAAIMRGAGALAAACGVAALVVGLMGVPTGQARAASKPAEPVVSITLPAGVVGAPQDGRLMLLFSTDPSDEPRMQISFGRDSQILFGLDVDGLAPGSTRTFKADAAHPITGWPVASLAALPPGEYTAQVVLHRYETFQRADGHTLKLPPDRGEGQQWNLAPGNLYSAPVKVRVAPGAKLSLTLDHIIPAIPAPSDTPFVRHVRIRSELLSRFWGRDVYIGAHVLLPAGFDEHPDAHYPELILHDHFGTDFIDFRTTPPDPDLKPDHSARFNLDGYNRIVQEESYRNYQIWTGKDFPRFLIIAPEHANPYYDDSYAVNSANLGPYGDAINHELLPYVEHLFRGMGQGWARFTAGGSTGGWEALATQVFYPDDYNGAFAACPDPIDFRAYTLINIYQDRNAYTLQGAHHAVERPSVRNYLGETLATQRDVNTYELARGERGRSGEQYDIWQAVFGPVGADGYPQPLFDKRTGVIDPAVAAYWRDHFDLSHIIERDWARIGGKLAGKIHIYVGLGDNYLLTDAVYYAEDRLKGLKNPEFGGEVTYGARAEHCWNGDPDLPIYLSRLHYSHQYVPVMLQRMRDTAPPGADLTSWRY